MTSPTPTPSTLSLSALHTALEQYPALIATLQASRAPSKQSLSLTDLDTFRYTTLPSRIASRRANATPAALLTKDELTTLVTWKLSHGTFRPALLKHVASNAESLVADTLRATTAMLPPPHDVHESTPTPTPASQVLVPVLTALAKPLKGIGPATASLVLSVMREESVPFFSDELYRWCVFGNAKGDWRSAEIKYTMKEYAALLNQVAEIRERLGLRTADGTRTMPKAVDLERAAYVWARSSTGSQPPHAQPATKPKPGLLDGDLPALATTKRKSSAADPPRRSSRRKLS